MGISPDIKVPEGSANTGSSSASGLAGFAAKDAQTWKDQYANNPTAAAFGGIGGWAGGLLNALMGIFSGASTVLSGISYVLSLRWLQVDNHENGFISLIGGYTGMPTPPTPPVLESIGSNLQTRITNLENGGQQWLLANSDTIDLSTFTEVKVWMWAASDQSGQFSIGDGGLANTMAFRAFTVAQLEAFGVDVSAVDVAPAAGQMGSATAAALTSKFAHGSAGWVMESTDAITDANGFTSSTPGSALARVGPAWQDSNNYQKTARYGRIVDNRFNGNTSRAAMAGIPGWSTKNSAAGAAGVANQTGDGGPGGNATNSDFTYREIAGGASGGSGAGGGVDGSTPKNGGNGGNAAWPGGYPGFGGEGGVYFPFAGSSVSGYPGFIGAPANGGVIVEAR